MDDYMPQLIRIMPDYGGEYVFDEDGGVFDVTSYFEDHPNVEQIRRIESPLYGWASLLETCAMRRCCSNQGTIPQFGDLIS